MNQTNAQRGEPTRDVGTDVEESQSLVDRDDPEFVRLREAHLDSILSLIDSCNRLENALMDHISRVDNKLVASLDKTSQTLYDLGVNALSKFQSLQDSEKLSECHRQPPGWRPEDRRNGDGTEVYDPSEEEMNFQRALDDAMEESSHLVAFARDACTKWGAYKAHVNTTVVRSASNELAYTEAAFELRKEKILTIERCYGSTEAAEAVDNDATGEPNTTLETELPQITGAATPMNLSDEDSGSSPQGDQGQYRRTRRRLIDTKKDCTTRCIAES